LRVPIVAYSLGRPSRRVAGGRSNEAEDAVPKYLFEARYTTEGAKGIEKEGGVSRREAVKKHLEQLGGKLEAMYFAFGDVDCYSIVDLPDNVSAAALSFAVNESGAIATRTVVLLTPEEVDKAVHKKVNFRAPGR
jgi:uncharacterized protein with GYD domain